MDRRTFLAGAAGFALTTPALAAVDPGTGPLLRGTLDAAELGLDPKLAEDQGRTVQRLLDAASADDRQVFLPAGTYVIGELKLPARTRLAGVPGGTRLVFGSGATMISAEDAAIIELSGLVIDGAHRPLEDYVPGIVHLANCANVTIENCTIIGAAKSALALDRSGGRITRNTIRDADEAGIRAIESTGLSITDNTVSDCGNAGILVYRWTAGDDGTLVTGNRVARIAANAGGTGQNGNGINVFRAHGVTVANNQISDCAFTAVRANSANNVQITGNTCRGSGEVGIYSEFSFEGAMIANNIVDGAASGINVVNYDKGGRIAVVSANIVRNLTGQGPYEHAPPGFGIGIAIEADVAATGNVIEGAPLYGMQMGFGPYMRDVTATGNVIRQAPIGVAVSVVDGAGQAVIADNVISGAATGAVVGMRWAEAATGDLALTGARGYPNLLVERNRVS